MPFENRSSGFALEYYDPVGRKRNEYRHVKEIDVKDGETAFQKKIKFTKVPIEAAMKLPNGREVRDLPSLKVALMADKERILKGIISKLVSYAHGREVTLADRPHIDEVYTSVAQNDFSSRHNSCHCGAPCSEKIGVKILGIFILKD